MHIRKIRENLYEVSTDRLPLTKVRTEFQSFGYVAVTENYTGPGEPIGSGFNREVAIKSLVETLEDKL